MKRIIAFSLCLALCLGLSACFKRTEEPTQTQAPTTETVTKSEVKENVYNYELLEDTLDKYVYDCIGGWMDISLYSGKLFFADHQYGTTAVNFYDFSSGSIKNMAIDNENKLSAPYHAGQKNILVGTLPENTDPLEADAKDYIYHLYDFEKMNLSVLDSRFDFNVVTYLDGKVYGNDEQGNVCFCNEDGSGYKTIKIGDNLSLNSVFVIGDDTYFELLQWGESNSYKLVRVNGEQPETLIDTPHKLFFDGEMFYYIKNTDSSTLIKKFDVLSDKSEEVCTTQTKANFIYFIAGDRVYFQTKLDDYNIALRYYDLKTGEEKEFSTGTPAMGGW